MRQAKMQKKQLSSTRSEDHPYYVRRLSSEKISSQISLRNQQKKLFIILVTEKSVERHPNPVSIKYHVHKNPVSSKLGESLVLSQIQTVMVSNCRTTIKVTS